MFYLKVVLMSILLTCASGIDMEDLKQKYAEIIMKCATEYPITATDIELLKNKQMPDNEASKCLFACAYKKTGMMNDEGELSVDGVNDLARLYLADDVQRLKQAEQFTDACKHVNDEPVDDGNKGCERAALIFKCSVEKASQSIAPRPSLQDHRSLIGEGKHREETCMPDEIKSLKFDLIP